MGRKTAVALAIFDHCDTNLTWTDRMRFQSNNVVVPEGKAIVRVSHTIASIEIPNLTQGSYNVELF